MQRVENLWSTLRGNVENWGHVTNTAAPEDDAWMRAMALLHAKQKQYYTRALQELANPHSRLGQATAQANELLMLIQAYTQVGWPKALRSNERLRGLLFGDDHLPGAFTLPGTENSDHFVEALTGASTAYKHCVVDSATGACGYGTWYSPIHTAPRAFGVDCPDRTEATTFADPVTRCLVLTGDVRAEALLQEYDVQSKAIHQRKYQEGLPELNDLIAHLGVVSLTVHA